MKKLSAMMNIQNIGSKESAGVKFSSGLKATDKYLASDDLLFLIKNIMRDGFCYEGFQICLEYFLYILAETIPTRFCY